MLDRITPLILTRDEEANIGRSLAHLRWAREVVIVDSLSTDATVPLAQAVTNTRIVQRPFDSLAGQSNFGIRQCSSEWVMLLDADYVVTDLLVDELRRREPSADVAAYECSFTYAVNGKPLRASLYPPRIVLFRRRGAEVWQDGHAHRVRVEGRVERLESSIIHDDRKSFARFLARQKTYMRQEAAKIRAASFASLSRSGRLRKLVVVTPLLVPAYVLLLRGTLFDGPPGWRYAWERFVAECMLSRELLRRTPRNRANPSI